MLKKTDCLVLRVVHEDIIAALEKAENVSSLVIEIHEDGEVEVSGWHQRHGNVKGSEISSDLASAIKRFFGKIGERA